MDYCSAGTVETSGWLWPQNEISSVFFLVPFPRHLPSSASEAQRDELQYRVSDVPGGEAVRAQHGETSFLSNSSGPTNWNRSPVTETAMAWGLHLLETSWPPELGVKPPAPMVPVWCTCGQGQPCSSHLSLRFLVSALGPWEAWRQPGLSQGMFYWHECPGQSQTTPAAFILGTII